MLPELQTNRLRLEPLHARHGDELYQLSSNPDVMRYSSLPVQTRDMTDAMLLDWIADSAKGRVCSWILRTDANRFVGQVSLYGIDHGNLRGEIGYMLMPQEWRKGYASEAIAAAVRYAFGYLELCRLEADVDPGNPGSWRALEKNGFRREGVMPQRWHKEGRFYDSWFYGLLNERRIRALKSEK